MSDITILVWSVDATTCKSLGAVPRGTANAVEVPGPHPQGSDWTYNFSTQQWSHDIDLASLKVQVSDAIDVAAGQARLRYITECTGQEMTYIKKEEQARDYVAAGNTGTVPPFVQAEADALGGTPADAAALIISTADSWGTTVGPTIEKVRRQGKIALDTATTIADVQAILVNYVEQLAAI